MNLCYISLKLLLKTYQTLFPQDCRIFNPDHVPPGAKIIAANHPNVTDTFHLAMVTKDQLHTLVMGDLFSVPLLGWLLEASGQIPVYPGQKGATLQKACEILETGGTVLIYPEAQLNPENRLLKGKAGAVRMSLISGAPIIPLGIYVPPSCTRTVRTHTIRRLRQGRWQTTGLCILYFGEPWLPSEEVHEAFDDALTYALTDQLMGKISNLSQKAFQAWLQDRPIHHVRYGWRDAFINGRGGEETW